jgi:PhzF family phenazine biosynthesis protein
MPALAYRLVNVFAESRLGGNPLAVFEDGTALDTATMQALALQFNLSETTFLLPPAAAGATARVRIFTPTFEMPFAGHPTLGTAHVVRTLKKTGDRVVLEMTAGNIPVEAQGDEWTLAANAPTWHAPEVAKADFAAMLGLAPADVLDGALWVDTGSEQLVIPLASADAVQRCRPDPALLARHSVGKKRASAFSSASTRACRKIRAPVPPAPTWAAGSSRAGRRCRWRTTCARATRSAGRAGWA